VLSLTLPGPVFVYQGDELGTPDGPEGRPPVDRAGRDPFRNPMVWSAGDHAGGFTTGEPWLPLPDVPGGGVAEQERDRTSMLWLYRELIGLRRRLRGPLELVDAAPGVIAFRRGDVLVAANLGAADAPVPDGTGKLLLSTHRHGQDTTSTISPAEALLANVRG
jgi:alpha-glucosidase